MPEGSVAGAAHRVGEIAAAEAAALEPGAEFVETQGGGREREIVGLDDEEAGLREDRGGAGEHGDFVTVGVEFEPKGRGQGALSDGTVDGFDRHGARGRGARGGDAAAIERGVDGEIEGAGIRTGGGGSDMEAVETGERGELGLAFGERFEEEEARGGEVPVGAERPGAVGGADIDPRADVDAAGGGAGEQAVHVEGTFTAREVNAERREEAVGGVAHAGFEALAHKIYDWDRGPIAGSGTEKTVEAVFARLA